MKHLTFLKHNLNQRITYDSVLTRYGELEKQNIYSLITSLFGKQNALVYGGDLQTVSGLTFRIIEDGFWIHKIGANTSVPIVQKEYLDLTVNAADPTFDRYDIIEGKLSIDDSNLETFDQINQLTGQVTSQQFYIDKKSKLEVRVRTGTPGSGVPLDVTAPIEAVFINDGNYDGDEVDLSSSIDLSSNFLINISIDGAAFVEVDCRGASPSSTSRSEIISAINTAVGSTVAFQEGTKYIKLKSLVTYDTSSIRIVPPSVSLNDGTYKILGLKEEGTYFYKYENYYEWFKIGEVRIQAGAVSLTSNDLKGVKEKDDWKKQDDSIDYIENILGIDNNINPVGSIIALHFDSPTPNSYRWQPCDGVAVLGRKFVGHETDNVPDLTDDRFLMGSSSSGSGGQNSFTLEQNYTSTGGKNINLNHAHTLSNNGYAKIDFSFGTLASVSIPVASYALTNYLSGLSSTGGGSRTQATPLLGSTDAISVWGAVSTADSHNHSNKFIYNSNPAALSIVVENRPKYFSVKYYIRTK